MSGWRAIRRVRDRTDPEGCYSYSLHEWRDDGSFEPQNGRIGCERDGEQMTEARAMRLLEDR